MPATSTIPAVLDALRAALLARPGMAGVTVYTGPAGPDEDIRRAILLGLDQAQATQTYPKLGDFSKDETVDPLTGAVYVIHPGAGETAIKASRDTAYALLAELELQLRETPTLGGVLPSRPIQFTTLTHEAGMTDKGRSTQLTFTLRWDARLSATP